MGLRAQRVVHAPRPAVFAFLADHENHWRLAQPFVEVLDITGPPGARDESGAHTRVTLEADVVRAGAADRALLALGGAWWLGRRFAATLARLDAVV